VKLTSAEAVEKAVGTFVTVTANGKTFALSKFAPGIMRSDSETKPGLVKESDSAAPLPGA